MRKTITNLYEEYVERHNGKPKHSFSRFIRVMSHIIHHKEEIKPQIIWWSDVNKTIRIMDKLKQ